MPVKWNCGSCGLEKMVPPSKAERDRRCGSCARSQRSGSNNPRFCDADRRICSVCGVVYRSYNKARKYCSQSCYAERRLRGQAASERQKRESYSYVMRASRKDNNHNEIAERFERGGAYVYDTSRMGRGFPDLLVGWAMRWHLVEIKNPKTSYGKHGLNENQKRFMAEWNGGPVYIVRTIGDVDRFLVGELRPVNDALPERVTDVDIAMLGAERLFLSASAEAIEAIKTKVAQS